MCDRPWETMTDAVFEAMLARSVPDVPPEEIVAEVTPWRRAMNRILFGMALCAITLNFLCLNYILPAVGTVLLLLGFRTLRRENRWLGGCFAITVVRAAYFFMTLILNTTILQSAVFTPAVTTALTAGNAALLLALYFCFWRGLLAVQAKAGLPAQAGGALALIVWYALVCVLAAVQYSGWVVPITMLIGYGFILRSLCRLSGALDEAGYAIAPGPVRVTDRCLVLVIAAVLGIGCTLGYLFGGSYPMDWQPVDTSEQAQTETIRQQLLGLGFPEDDMYGVDLVIADMTYLVKNKQKIRGLFLTHGHVFGAGMHNSVDHAPALPEGSALVYGHTHIKVNEESAAHPGLWLFNPGSVSIPKDGSHSYGIYEDGSFRHVVLEEA